jgi:anhydro-N-acetylmuramic acid kinase
MKTYKVIGIMSGTSLDGVDIAYCIFVEDNDIWKYKIEIAETYNYNSYWKEILSTAAHADSFDFIRIHKQYGNFLGGLVSEFILRNKIAPDFIASHGHTIFHQPDKKITFQIGDGAELAAACGYPVVCDFRSIDVALGGQGAPLVPVGDKLLFGNYDYCLNLGGIANISFEEKGKRIAFDICPANMALNNIVEMLGKSYDDKGAIATSGHVNRILLNKLNELDYYNLHSPKSLGKEWVFDLFMPMINAFDIPVEDKLCTICVHIAMQISAAAPYTAVENILVTGGGAYNTFLMEKIRSLCPAKIVIPDNKNVEFKEALIFAFLGVLRMRGEVNCLSSVTGAIKDSVGGTIYFGLN